MPSMLSYHASTSRHRGVVLLMVLFIVMAVTIISLGIMARSTTEMAAGQNMALRIEMDQLAASGLEHARGLILNPQDPDSSEIDPVDMYWTGATDLRLDPDSEDYYDVTVQLDDQADPNTRCNYTIDCEARRASGSGEIGRSHLSASLRLDPCIGLWTGVTTRIPPRMSVYGDVYCAESLTNSGSIDGDVFANSLTGTIGGQAEGLSDLSLGWPSLTASDFVYSSPYTVEGISAATLSSNLGPDEPDHIFSRVGDLIIGDGVTIDGMLLVDGNLTIRGNDVTLVAGRSLPAVYVTGDLIVEDVDNLAIKGLLAVDGVVRVSAGATNVSVSGAAFAAAGLTETAPDASGYHHDLLVSGAPTWQPSSGRLNGALAFDGVDDLLEEPSAGDYLNGLTAITVAMWLKSDVVNQDRGIMFTATPDAGDVELGCRYDQNGSGGYAPRVIKASLQTTSGYTQIESTADVQTTAWQHVALVWESGSPLKLYVDGLENPLSYTRMVPDANGLSGSVTAVTKLLLGVGTKGNIWSGLMDDVRIYNQALNAGEVLSLYQGSLAGLPNPIAYWALDDEGMDVRVVADPAKAAIASWPDGARTTWSPAAGAFFKSINREP